MPTFGDIAVSPLDGKLYVVYTDNSAAAYDSNGLGHAVWTDMRRLVTAFGKSGYTQNIFYATV